MMLDQILAGLGQQKHVFCVGGVAKIKFSWKLDLGGFRGRFWRHFGTKMATQRPTILTLGVPVVPIGGIGSRSRFHWFLMTFREGAQIPSELTVGGDLLQLGP